MERKPEPKKAIASQKNTVLKSTPWTPSDKANLAEALGKVFDLQKQFGKTHAQLGSMVEGYAWVLADYPMERVIWGLGQYMRTKTDIPAPADICLIIDPPPPKWEPDRSYYIKLQQIFKTEGPYGLNDDEYEYIRRYEEHVLKNHRDSK